MGARVSSVFERASVRWATALIATAIALLVARELRPFLGELAPLITALPAVAMAAWLCGLRPSFASIAITLLGAKYWFLAPPHSFSVISTSQAIILAIWVLACGIVAALGEMNRRENEKLLNEHDELEGKVRQRTVQLDLANQSLSELTARLLQLQDEERRRIARDLHDSIGQTMAALGLNLSNVQTEMERLLNTINVVKDSREIVRETSTNVRTISYLLHPPLLDENGLSSALPWYVEGFAGRSGIQAKLDLPEELGRLSRDSEVAIFRVVQESLTNIHRHSGASNAHIRVSRSNDEICVRVEDDGKGITAEKLDEMASAGTPGVGIRGMRERLRQLSGTLQIDSKGPGKGTVIVIRLPFVSYDGRAEDPTPPSETKPPMPPADPGTAMRDAISLPNDEQQNFSAHA
ncbi:MAG TPA: sensor histidine kinase [Candidatus Acidoferrales bacterium]